MALGFGRGPLRVSLSSREVVDARPASLLLFVPSGQVVFDQIVPLAKLALPSFASLNSAVQKFEAPCKKE
jgi:hypothetical protein